MNPEYLIAPSMNFLPNKMRDKGAIHMVLAIGFQETNFMKRYQMDHGPARGFWQFEINGLMGVLQHKSSRPYILDILRAMRYPVTDVVYLMEAIEHNDILAFVFARLLLWTLPSSLPGPFEIDKGWAQYISAWRPGKPRREDWDYSFTTAREIVYGL